MKKIKLTQGFTLIELLVVIAIIGILGAIVYAPFQTARRKGRDAQKIVEMKNLQSAITLYADSHDGQYPNSLYALQAAMTDKLPSKANTGASPTTGPAVDLAKYNYSAFTSAGRVVGYHLYTHLETNSPVLTGAASCYGIESDAATRQTACVIAPSPVATAAESTTEPANGTGGAYFTDRSGDSDNTCATDITRCVYDLKS